MSEPLIRANDVRVSRADRTLGPWSLTAQAGELVVVCGANGGGKSTLLRVLAGLQAPDTGTVTRPPAPVGFAPEPFISPPGLRVRELLALVCRNGDAAQVVTASMHLHPILDRAVSTLSRGERKRVVTAQALLDAPPLVVLDEPLEGLDAPSRERTTAAVHAYVREGGCAIIASHRPDAWDATHRIDVDLR